MFSLGGYAPPYDPPRISVCVYPVPPAPRGPTPRRRGPTDLFPGAAPHASLPH